MFVQMRRHVKEPGNGLREIPMSFNSQQWSSSWLVDLALLEETYQLDVTPLDDSSKAMTFSSSCSGRRQSSMGLRAEASGRGSP
eukprot:superscaffoldBa00000604_g6001